MSEYGARERTKVSVFQIRSRKIFVRGRMDSDSSSSVESCHLRMQQLIRQESMWADLWVMIPKVPSVAINEAALIRRKAGLNIIICLSTPVRLGNTIISNGWV